MSDFTFSRQCVSEPLFLFVSGTSSCCLCSLREEGMGVVAHFLPTLCRQGQRSGQVCGCTTVLLGANILTHSSVSLVGAVPQQAPVLELFTELFLIRNYPLTSLYNGEAGTVMTYLVHSSLPRSGCRCGSKHSYNQAGSKGH